MIGNVMLSLRNRSYKIYQGLEDPPLECIDQVVGLFDTDIPDHVGCYWKKWLEMCMETCDYETKYDRAEKFMVDHLCLSTSDGLSTIPEDKEVKSDS
jgi:hypothetical protein